MNNQVCSIIDLNGKELARFEIEDHQEGWYYAKVAWQEFPEGLHRALEWYDDVVSNQMLSYLDEAVAAIDSYRLRVRLQGEVHPVYSLQITKTGDVSFRITPVPPPEATQ